LARHLYSRFNFSWSIKSPLFSFPGHVGRQSGRFEPRVNLGPTVYAGCSTSYCHEYPQWIIPIPLFSYGSVSWNPFLMYPSLPFDLIWLLLDFILFYFRHWKLETTQGREGQRTLSSFLSCRPKVGGLSHKLPVVDWSSFWIVE
jgi:hypothetical protein